MTEPLATATAARAFSPALYRAARVLRMGGGEMLSFLQNEAALNPFLRIENERDWLRPDDAADLDCAAAAAADDGEAQNPREHLRAALFETAAAADPRVAALAREMCEWVDDDGFFPDAEAEFAADPRFAAALDLLQSAGPPGLAARDLRECLLLQLAAQKPAPSAPAADLADWAAARALVADHLPALVRKRRDRLPRRRLRAALRRIESLQPRPGARFAPPPPPASPPDVLFRRRRGLWKAEPGPGLRLSARAGGDGGEWRGIDGNLRAAAVARARALAAVASSRRRAVLRVAQFAADRQAAFFESGAGALAPLSAAAAAESLGVSPAFVSHALADKTARAAGGLFALKSLFARESKNARSTAAVGERIRGMIEKEDPARPLSDRQIGACLRADGLRLSRRAVAKRRDAAGFLCAARRKRLAG